MCFSLYLGLKTHQNSSILEGFPLEYCAFPAAHSLGLSVEGNVKEHLSKKLMTVAAIVARPKVRKY